MKQIHKNRLLAVTGTLTLLALPSVSHAQFVWNMNTATPSSGSIFGLTTSAISRGNNNGTTTLLTAISASNNVGASGGNNAGAAALIGALSTVTSTYFEVTLTPDFDYAVNFTGISFGERSTSTGPQAISVRTSVDNYATELAGSTGLSTGATWTLLNPTPAFSIAAAPSTPITIRIYGYNGAGSALANTANWRIDDLTLTGAAIPEPATLSFLAMGGVGVLVRLRRKK
jgi:hypothetical protein